MFSFAGIINSTILWDSSVKSRFVRGAGGLRAVREPNFVDIIRIIDTILLQNFIEDPTVIELESSIKYATVDIRKANKIKLPDAIIAATALVYNLTLITRGE